jgi:hypothetical protein
LIPHAVAFGPLSGAQVAVVVPVVGSAFGARPVPRLGGPHLLIARRRLVVRLAVDLAPVAGPADREEAQALGAPLEEESVVVHV